MFDSISISFIFGLINFCILSGGAIYFFIKRIKPQLVCEINKAEGVHEEMKVIISTLETQEENIRLSTIQQEKLAQKLIENSKQWAESVKQKQSILANEEIGFEQKRKIRASQQHMIQVQKKFARQAIPEVAKTTEQNLTEYFTNKDHQTTYMKAILIHLQSE